MLTEFLKSIRGEKALWETIITGVDVCNFRLQGNTKDPFIPISLQPLRSFLLFCRSCCTQTTMESCGCCKKAGNSFTI